MTENERYRTRPGLASQAPHRGGLLIARCWFYQTQYHRLHYSKCHTLHYVTSIACFWLHSGGREERRGSFSIRELNERPNGLAFSRRKRAVLAPLKNGTISRA